MQVAVENTVLDDDRWRAEGADLDNAATTEGNGSGRLRQRDETPRKWTSDYKRVPTAMKIESHTVHFFPLFSFIVFKS